MLASAFVYLRHFLAKIRKSEPRIRIMSYLLREESLFVLDSIPKGCLKIAINIAKMLKAKLILIHFKTQILCHKGCLGVEKNVAKGYKNM